MPSFTYVARDGAGRTQNGDAAAESAAELVSNLRGRGWIVLDIQASAATLNPAHRISMNPFDWLPPSKLDVEIGFLQMASMLRSGITLLAAIKTTAEQARRPSMTRVWQQVYERIEEGASFANGLAEHPRCFPEFVIQLVRVGEQSGTLEVVLTRAAEQLERARNLRMTLLNALLYPAIVVLMAILVTAFMLFSVIPKIQKFLSGRGRHLPAITQLLLDISTWMQLYYAQVAIGIVAVVVALVLIYRWPPGRLKIDAFLLRVPIFGKLFRNAATAMFARSLGLLLESGVTLLDGLGTTVNLISNRALSEHVGNVRQSVMQGGTLAAPLNEPRYGFMPMLGRMVAIGEATGTLGTVLAEVADFHEKQLAASVRRLSVLIEPVTIVVVGGIVGFVYIAFFMALFSLAG